MKELTRRSLARRDTPPRHQPVPPVDSPPDGVPVKNTSAFDCPRGGLLAITGAAHPTQGGTKYFEGTRPTAAGMPNVVVAIQAIPACLIGPCSIWGPCRIACSGSPAVGDRLASAEDSFEAAIAEGGAASVWEVLFLDDTRVYGVRSSNPIVAPVKLATITEAPSASDEIACTIDGEEETLVEVNGQNWEDVLPNPASSAGRNLVFAVQLDGVWYGIPPFAPVGKYTT